MCKYTEYAVEVNDKNGLFVRQIEVFSSYDKAQEFADKFNVESLGEGEQLNIIYIDYDENGDEIGFGSVV
jgi:hypothetical protein